MTDMWNEARREFPAASRYAYLNAAAASPVPRCVRAAVDTMMSQLEHDGDRHWETWLTRRDEIRTTLARFIGAASPDEIAFVPNTSAGINTIVDLLQDDGPVLTDTLEFPTVTLPWIHRGVPMHFVEPRNGALRAEDFAEGTAPAAATLAISHVQYSNGCRQDLTTFGSLKGARRFVVCASQSAGAFPIDVQAQRIDALASAGHKWMCAGYGAGFLYVSRELLARPPRTMGWLSVQDPFAFDNRHYALLPTAERYELGCPSFTPIVALGAAVEFLMAIGIEAIATRVLTLNMHLTECLTAAGLEVLSPGGPHRSGETLCRVPDPARAVVYLEANGVLVTQKPEGVRIATHFFNNEEDIERGVAALAAYMRTVHE